VKDKERSVLRARDLLADGYGAVSSKVRGRAAPAAARPGPLLTRRT